MENLVNYLNQIPTKSKHAIINNDTVNIEIFELKQSIFPFG